MGSNNAEYVIEQQLKGRYVYQIVAYALGRGAFEDALYYQAIAAAAYAKARRMMGVE